MTRDDCARMARDLLARLRADLTANPDHLGQRMVFTGRLCVARVQAYARGRARADLRLADGDGFMIELEVRGDSPAAALDKLDGFVADLWPQIEGRAA